MTQDFVKIGRALLSVSDKTGLEPLGRALASYGTEILSSGGTAAFLRERGIPVTEVAEFTGAPEMLDGRIKTLHPKIHGGLLAIRGRADHAGEMERQGYLPIDLVVVNLYPFERAAREKGKPFLETLELIDIGGPALLRSAAKNFPSVTALVDPGQYPAFLEELAKNGGSVSLEFRGNAARRVFERTAAYDAVIAGVFQEGPAGLPEHLPIALERKWPMRYGENPHQEAAFYLPAVAGGATLLEKVLQGKPLSYNNLTDVHAALDLILEFPSGFTTAILKHTNPCGIGASGGSLLEAYRRALACDPVSAFGGIVVFSHDVDGATAAACTETFTEIVIAPGCDEDARTRFAKKTNLRLLEIDFAAVRGASGGLDLRRVADGYLVQTRDRAIEDLRSATVATKRPPSDDELQALTLAWRAAKHVKSNAIVLASAVQTVGIGAGQTSRVDACRIALAKAGPDRARGAAMASDAFFPFRDSVDEAARAGVTAVVQPGGSVRDAEVIAAADEHGLTLLLTGVRHFRH